MKINVFPAIYHTVKHALTVSGLCVATCLGANSASALVIDFDDLYYDPNLFETYSHSIENQYASQGVTFFEAFLEKDWHTGNQSAFGLGGFVIRFTGKLPTYVSFGAFSQSIDGLAIDVFGKPGGGFDRVVIPATISTVVNLSEPTGISEISLHNRQERTGMGIDNITIDYASVPEPAPLVLLSLGLIAVSTRLKMRGAR